jgi:hypothetical protein
VTRRILRVARGSRRGADVALAEGTNVIGREPTLCQVALDDEGVARRHAALTLDARGHVICTALDAEVWVGQRALPPGASMSMPDFLPLRCGQATLLVGPEGSDWRYSMVAAERSPNLRQHAGAALQHVRSVSPLAFAALLLGSMLLLGGSVGAAVSWLTAPQRQSGEHLARVQRWLLAVSPRGSELQLIVDEARQQLVVAGYVNTEREREALMAQVARHDDTPRTEVVSVERMLAALARVAQQQGLACQAAYRGGGRAACNNTLDDAAAAERLQLAAAAEVQGLRDLTLDVAEPPRAVAARVVERSPAKRRYAVLMSNKRGNQLIGPRGERWREGDAFDGMTIRRIELDQVVFARDQSELVLQLAQLN